MQTQEVIELSKQIKEKLKEADQSGMFIDCWSLYSLFIVVKSSACVGNVDTCEANLSCGDFYCYLEVFIGWLK